MCRLPGSIGICLLLLIVVGVFIGSQYSSPESFVGYLTGADPREAATVSSTVSSPLLHLPFWVFYLLSAVILFVAILMLSCQSPRECWKHKPHR